MRTEHLALSLSAILFASCTTTTAVAPVAAETTTALFTRERPEMQTMEVRSLAGDVVFTTEATARPRLTPEGDGVYALDVPIGTDRPLKCWLRTDGTDARWLLANVLTDAKRATASFEIVNTRAGTLGQVAFVHAEAHYSVEKNGERLQGGLLATVFDGSDIVVACLHDEPGYRATFQRVTEGIMKSLKIEVVRKPTPVAMPGVKYTMLDSTSR
jgi:hypothetical protein